MDPTVCKGSEGNVKRVRETVGGSYLVNYLICHQASLTHQMKQLILYVRRHTFYFRQVVWQYADNTAKTSVYGIREIKKAEALCTCTHGTWENICLNLLKINPPFCKNNLT